MNKPCPHAPHAPSCTLMPTMLHPKAKIQPPEECWPATKAYSYPEPSMEVVMNPAPYIKKQFRAFFAFIKSTLGYIPSTDDGWKSIFNLSNSTPPAER